MTTTATKELTAYDLKHTVTARPPFASTPASAFTLSDDFIICFNFSECWHLPSVAIVANPSCSESLKQVLCKRVCANL